MTSVKRSILLITAKLVSWTSTTLHLGAGGTWPGEIALRFEPKILTYLAGQLEQIVLITGTNGKTTTAKMVKTILTKNQEPRTKNKKVIIHNSSGANLLNGITSALIQTTDFWGKVKADIGIFEVDEMTLPLAINEFTPQVVVLLNLFRDQLDRYGEVDLVAEKWLDVLENLPKSLTMVINADDPHLAYIGTKLKAKVKYFGLGDKQQFLDQMPHAADTIYCPNCGKRLFFEGVYLSHLGEWRCLNCHLSHPRNDIGANDVSSPLPGLYNLYNTLAAILIVRELGIAKKEELARSLESFQPAFGRQEEFAVNGKKVKIFLSKNPAGFNVSLRTVLEFKPKTLLLVLNDRIPDGRDVSWIWDVDFEMIPDNVTIIVSGDRVYDMAMRIKYARKVKSEKLRGKSYSEKLKVFEDLKEAITYCLNQIDKRQVLYILPTYSAMLGVRQILTGRRIL